MGVSTHATDSNRLATRPRIPSGRQSGTIQRMSITTVGLLFLSTWIHEDIDKGYAEAKAQGKPLLVSFR